MPKVRNNSRWQANLRQYNIIWWKSSCRCNVNCFFSHWGKVEGDSTLPLHFIEYAVHCLKSYHLRIHLHCHFFANLLNNGPHIIQQSVRLNFGCREFWTEIPVHSCCDSWALHCRQELDNKEPSSQKTQKWISFQK